MGASTRGRTLGRYELVKHLATGGMAEVLLARATGLEGFERYVVVKQILAERARDDAMVRMFLDEARLAASLHHANIVQVHDVGQDRGDYFLAMEYIHGEDLHAVLRTLSAARRRPPLDHVLTIVSAVASALHYAHEQKGPDRAPLELVHRDVSLSNILVGYDGNVKVVDFGIARAAHRSNQTLPGILKGKISYMSPEQCLGAAIDRRSDVFSLGIVLFELACVRRLFKAGTDFLTMSQIVSGNVPRPSLFRTDLPAELEAIMVKALAADPAERFHTADEMRIALDQVAAHAGLRTSTTALADYMVELFGRRPEPWLTDDVAVAGRSDFEGSGEGVAKAPTANRLPAQTAQPGSPLDRAWRNPGNKLPTASGTPMGWAPAPVAASRRKWWIGGAAIAMPAVAAMIFIALRTPELAQAPHNAAAPSTASAPAALAPLISKPAASPPAAKPVEPSPAATVSAPAEPTVPAALVPTADAGHARSKPAVRSAPSKTSTTNRSSAPVAALPRPHKPSAPDKPEAAPVPADKPAPDKPDSWNPDALFLKAPQ